jgi:hypothetical protein
MERSEQLLRRKEIYEALNPVAKPVHQTGIAGPGRGHKKTDADSASVSFATDTAIKTGTAKRTIQEEVQIATNIEEPVKEMIRGTASRS